MLGICYTCVALCCSAHGFCAVECSAACCAAQYTAIATITDTMAEYELGDVNSALNTIMDIRTIGLAVKPSQSKVATQSMEL